MPVAEEVAPEEEIAGPETAADLEAGRRKRAAAETPDVDAAGKIGISLSGCISSL